MGRGFAAWERRWTARGRTAILLPSLTRSRGYVLGVLVADIAVDSTPDGYVDRVLAANNDTGVDVVLESTGGAAFARRTTGKLILTVD